MNKDKQIVCYAPGTEVMISRNEDKKISANITTVCIRSIGTITYEICWWDGGVRKVENVREWEITPKIEELPKITVGFQT